MHPRHRVQNRCCSAKRKIQSRKLKLRFSEEQTTFLLQALLQAPNRRPPPPMYGHSAHIWHELCGMNETPKQKLSHIPNQLLLGHGTIEFQGERYLLLGMDAFSRKSGILNTRQFLNNNSYIPHFDSVRPTSRVKRSTVRGRSRKIFQESKSFFPGN